MTQKILLEESFLLEIEKEAKEKLQKENDKNDDSDFDDEEKNYRPSSFVGKSGPRSSSTFAKNRSSSIVARYKDRRSKMNSEAEARYANVDEKINLPKSTVIDNDSDMTDKIKQSEKLANELSQITEQLSVVVDNFHFWKIK